MVIIALYKPHVTHMKYIEGKSGVFLIENDSYFILQEISDLYSNLKCSNIQLYIRQWFILYMWKILVKSYIIKDILKQKKDVQRISDGTIARKFSIHFFAYLNIILSNKRIRNVLIRLCWCAGLTVFCC